MILCGLLKSPPLPSPLVLNIAAFGKAEILLDFYFD
jgi:hypothetical protein